MLKLMEFDKKYRKCLNQYFYLLREKFSNLILIRLIPIEDEYAY